MNGSDKDYCNATKQNWRGWAWNQIARRLQLGQVPIDRASVLYLAGPQDNDRAHALSKGFRESSLIPIDSSLRNIRRIREQGHIAIHDDIAKICVVADQAIDAVLLDYCGGVSAAAVEGLWSLYCSRSLHARSVVVWNFLRGRDQAEGRQDMRDVLQQHASSSEWVWDKRLRRYVDTCHKTPCGKHRGKEWYWYVLRVGMTLFYASALKLDAASQWDEAQAAWGAAMKADPQEWQRVQRIAWEVYRPSYYSYRSGRLVFDSIALTWGRDPMLGLQDDAAKTSQTIRRSLRRWVAFKAVRTRRLQGGQPLCNGH